MGLCNVYEYLQQKTIKLSDSYSVQIRVDDANYYDLYECTSVTLPTVKMKTDTYQYGNNTKLFIYPDYSNIGEVELEFIEHYTNDNKLSIANFVNICLNKLFDTEHFAYKLDDYINELIINVYDNNFSEVVMQHVFHELKLVDYTKYDLDYSSTDIAKWTLKFMFREYYAGRPAEVYEALNPPPELPYQDSEVDHEEMYNAMMEARANMMRGGRGVQTPTENLDMARDRLENLKKEQAAAGPLTQQENAELNSINKRRALLTTELQKIEQQEGIVEKALAEKNKKTEIRDPNKDAAGALSDVVKRTTEELHVQEASETIAKGVENTINESGLEKNSMALANIVGDMSVALGKTLGIGGSKVTDVAAPELTAAPEYSNKMTKADILAELKELDEYEAEIKNNIAARSCKNRNELNTIQEQIDRFENDLNLVNERTRGSLSSVNKPVQQAHNQSFIGKDINQVTLSHENENYKKLVNEVNLDLDIDAGNNNYDNTWKNGSLGKEAYLGKDMTNTGIETRVKSDYDLAAKNNTLRRAELLELDEMDKELLTEAQPITSKILADARISNTTKKILNYENNNINNDELTVEDSVTEQVLTPADLYKKSQDDMITYQYMVTEILKEYAKNPDYEDKNEQWLYEKAQLEAQRRMTLKEL